MLVVGFFVCWFKMCMLRMFCCVVLIKEGNENVVVVIESIK